MRSHGLKWKKKEPRMKRCEDIQKAMIVYFGLFLFVSILAARGVE